MELWTYHLHRLLKAEEMSEFTNCTTYEETNPPGNLINKNTLWSITGSLINKENSNVWRWCPVYSKVRSLKSKYTYLCECFKDSPGTNTLQNNSWCNENMRILRRKGRLPEAFWKLFWMDQFLWSVQEQSSSWEILWSWWTMYAMATLSGKLKIWLSIPSFCLNRVGQMSKMNLSM